MKLIGLTGPAGSGKDTVARFLCDTQGFVQIAYADPLRDALKAMFGFKDSDFTDHAKKDTVVSWLGASPRGSLNNLGKWARENIDQEILIFIVSRKIEQIRRAHRAWHITGIVITDIRLEQEVSWFHRQGGELWHIHRTTTAYTGPVINVRSPYEQGVEFKPGDRIIHNDSSIDALHEHIAQLFTNEEEPS